MGWRVVDVDGGSEHPTATVTFATYQAAAKQAAFLNFEHERAQEKLNGGI